MMYYCSHFIGRKMYSKFSAQDRMTRQKPDLFNSIAYPLYHTIPERVCGVARC